MVPDQTYPIGTMSPETVETSTTQTLRLQTAGETLNVNTTYLVQASFKTWLEHQMAKAYK